MSRLRLRTPEAAANQKENTVLKKLAIVLALGGALAVAGCKTNDTGGSAIPPIPGNTVAEKTAAVIAEVQEKTRTACKFVPTATTVINLLRVFGVGDYSGITAVASEVCRVMGPPTNATARRSAGPKTLRGVEIRGTYVR